MLLKPWSRNVPRYSMAGHELHISQSQKVARRPEQVGEACEPKIQMRPLPTTCSPGADQTRNCVRTVALASKLMQPGTRGLRATAAAALSTAISVSCQKKINSHAHFGTFSRSISFVVQRSPFRLLGQPCLLHLLGSSIAHDCAG